jgi:DNA-binding transcriptional MerR regulator
VDVARAGHGGREPNRGASVAAERPGSPDERTVRYYVTLGLLDRPSAMRGRTALYSTRHVAQVVAIKRLQTMGRSLSEIQGLWPTLDDRTLSRMSGVELATTPRPTPRTGFWKREPASPVSESRALTADAGSRALTADAAASADAGRRAPASDAERGAATADAESRAPRAGELRVAPTALELRIELAPHVVLSLSVVESVALSPADVRALRAAAAPLLAELASRGLAPHSVGEEP